MMPPRMLRSRVLAGAGVVVFCLGGAAMSMWFFLSLYVQQVLGYSAMEAGLTFLPMSLTIVACTQLASRLAARVGAGRVLATGMTLFAAGLLLLSRADAVLVPSLLCASGIGCSFVSINIAAAAAVPHEDSGLASGLVNTAFQVGGSLGLAVLSTTAEGFHAAFATAGGVALAGAALALVVIGPTPRRGGTPGRSGRRRGRRSRSGARPRPRFVPRPRASGSAVIPRSRA
jgi:predicted MFS family arabinose efflux permease